VHPSLLNLRIIWGAILTTVSAFVAVLAFGVRIGSKPPESALLVGLGAAALLLAVASQVLFRLVLRQGLARETPRIDEVHDQHSPLAQYRGATPTRRVFANRDQAMLIALRALQSATIVGVAVSESVGLLGFVLGLHGFGVLEVAPFFALSMLLMLLLFPSEGRAIAALERQHGAVMPQQ
jgi:hypothetical protein